MPIRANSNSDMSEIIISAADPTTSNATQRTNQFVSDYGSSLQDISNMSESELKMLYNSFSPLASAAEYLKTAEHGYSDNARSQVIDMANEYRQRIADKLQMFADEANSIQGQTEQMQQSGINPDLNGVSAAAAQTSPSGNPSNNPHYSEIDKPLQLADFALRVLTSGASISSGISGISSAGVNNAMQKLNIAGKITDITRNLVDMGVNDASQFGFSRRYARSINKGINEVPQIYKQNLIARQNAQIVENLVKSAESESKLDLMPLLTEVQQIELKGQKIYESSRNRLLEALKDNSKDSLDIQKDNFASSELSYMDPEHRSRVESLQETSLNDKITQDRLSSSDRHKMSDESLKHLIFNNDREKEAYIHKRSYVHYLESEINDVQSKLNRYYNHPPVTTYDNKRFQMLKAIKYRLQTQRAVVLGSRSSDNSVADMPYNDLRDNSDLKQLLGLIK